MNKINGIVLTMSPLKVSRPSDKIVNCEPNRFPYSYEHYKTGATLPLHPFVVEVLSYYDLTPFQLTVNSYKVILGMYDLFKILGFPNLNARGFGYYYQLKQKSKNNHLFFVLSPWGKVKDMANNVDNGGPWKWIGFYVETGQASVRPTFNSSPNKFKSSRPRGNELDRFNIVQSLLDKLRKIRLLCDPFL